uniref:Endonuclease/exonuclease/phosphatase domain-containing protein n=1 Tax=Kryptolebias marmoratus TaxID=37003 RepID=A0A3Q3AU80_KRYMA
FNPVLVTNLSSIASLNVNGMNNPIKRKKILNKMRIEKVQLIYLQETHLPKLEHEKLRVFGYSKVFYSSFRHGSKRVVSILIHDLSHDLSDKEGRYVIVKGTLDNIKVTLVNVYNPPNSNIQFLLFSIK